MNFLKCWMKYGISLFMTSLFATQYTETCPASNAHWCREASMNYIIEASTRICRAEGHHIYNCAHKNADTRYPDTIQISLAATCRLWSASPKMVFYTLVDISRQKKVYGLQGTLPQSPQCSVLCQWLHRYRNMFIWRLERHFMVKSRNRWFASFLEMLEPQCF